MRLWVKRAVFGLVIAAFLLIGGFYLVIYYAFGPIYTSGAITLPDDSEIYYEEQYVADFADWWYNVTFFFNDSTSQKITFKSDNWHENVSVGISNGKKYISISDSPYVLVMSFNDNFDPIYCDTVPFKSFNLEQYIRQD